MNYKPLILGVGILAALLVAVSTAPKPAETLTQTDTADYGLIREVSSFAAPVTQGIAYDGTHVYVSGNTQLRKYTTGGSLVTSRDTSSDSTANEHLGDIFVKDGVIYGAASNYPDTPRLSYIAKWNASDLSYIGEEFIDGDNHNSTLAYANGYWWMVLYQDQTIAQIDDSFDVVAIHDIPFDFEAGNLGFDGMFWLGETMYLNPHSGQVPAAVQAFYWDNGFTHIRSLSKPQNATQGMDIDPSTGDVWMLRYDATGGHQAVKAKLEVEDLRGTRVSFAKAASDHSTNSTSYVEDSQLKGSIYVKKGDIVEAVLNGMYYTSGPTMRAYTDVASDSPVAATILSGMMSLRTNYGNSEGQTLTFYRAFRANEDGLLKVSHWWKMNAAGTAHMKGNSQLVLKVIGRDWQ